MSEKNVYTLSDPGLRESNRIANEQRMERLKKDQYAQVSRFPDRPVTKPGQITPAYRMSAEERRNEIKKYRDRRRYGR